MADTQNATKKRHLRVPNETVREKATKAQEAAISPQPKRVKQVTGIAVLPFRALAWISHRPPLKQIGHAFRWFFSLRFMRFLGKITGMHYVRNSARELRLVNWPSRKQSRQLTTAVIIFSIVFGGLIAVVDLGLNRLFKDIVLK